MGQTISCPISKKKSKTKYVSNAKTKKVEMYKGPPGSFMVQAKYKYDAMGESDISFEEKEIMYVIHTFDEHWYEVIKQKDNQRGFVPSSYVRKQDGSPQSVDGWMDIQRWEAEKLLMKVGLTKGTFIIRPSRKENSFALSVRDFKDVEKMVVVKHFQIKVNQNNEEIHYLLSTREFSDILTMIFYFQKNGIGNSHVYLADPYPDNYQPPLHFQDIEINRENIDILNEIGHGCFGSVFKAKWGRNYEVAVKMLQSTKSERKSFLQEAKIMHKLRHRKIVELLGICSEPPDIPMLIVLEFMKNGSLKEYLRSDDGQTISLSQMIHMMADISEGMAYLENKKVVHRDLRADNILVNSELTVKVADFGLTEIVDENSENQASKNKKFPYKWTAPEAAKSRIFTTKSDIWSFGIVIYEIVTWAKVPYPDTPANQIIDKLLTGYRMPNPETLYKNVRCPSVIYQIMVDCWNETPAKRPTFQHLLDRFDLIIVENAENAEYYNPIKKL